VKRFLSVAIVYSFLIVPVFPQSANKPLTIEAIFAEGGIAGRGPETIKWSPDSTKFSFIQRDDSGEHGQLWYVDASTGEKKVLVSELKLAALAPPATQIKDEREKERVTRYHVAAYEWAPDSKRLLFDSQGQLWLYTIDIGTAVQITSASEPSGDPKFSPDGSRVSYLREHNLYVRSVNGGQEKQLAKPTGDREKDAILLNGEVDWVYAEELDVRSNYFWSPNGKDVLYLQMDETSVPAYPIVNWLPLQPGVDMQKYPKPGDPNPVVRLGVVSSDGGKTKWITLTENQDTYIPRFGWVRDGLLWAEVLNRAQDTMDLYFADAHSGRSRKVLTETAPNAWINVNNDFKVLNSGDHFLWSSWRDGTTQLYLYSFEKTNPLAVDAKLEQQLTKGDFEMLGLDGVDENAATVYVTCNQDPRQRQLYSVRLDGSEFKQVSQQDGTHESTFADDGKHYVDQYSDDLIPPNMSICTPGGPCNKVWDSRTVNDFGLIAPKFLDLTAEDGTRLYGKLLLPVENASGAKTPLIVYIYGGPAAQTVRKEWMGTTELFHELLAQKGFAIFTVDNRGTPGRDRKFQTTIRHEYGAIELKDQLSALDQLFSQYPQLDRTRVAIWGWSNGGSMTLYSVTHSDAFKAAVSVAPVTDWRDYDSIYTERYQGLPKDNGKGYQDLRPSNMTQLHGSLLLVHGTSDDNVHFQNSVQMSEAFIQSGRQFRFMIYPNKTHGIGGSQDRDHLFHMIEDHFEQELK